MSVARTYLDLFRRNRALTQLLAGEFISGIGDWLYLVAILVVIYTESNSAVLLGIIGAARILPYVVLSVPAGIVADRFDRRMVLLVTDVARGLIMLALAAAVVVGASPFVIVALAVLATCFSTFFNPAIAALLPTLVDEDDLGPANGAWSTLDNVAFIIGPALAGILLAQGNLALAFFINAVTFGIVSVILWRLPVSTRGDPTVEAGASEENDEPAVTGWRGLIRGMVGPLTLDAANSFVSGGINVLVVLIAVETLSEGEAATGWLQAATGVGGVVAGIAAGMLAARRLQLPLVLGGVTGAVGLAWLALAGDLLIAMIAIGIGVAGLLMLDVVNTTYIQRTVPNEQRGRAMGLLQTSSAIVYMAGSFALPVAASLVGVPTVLIGSAAIVVIGVGAALLIARTAAPPVPVDPARLRLLEHPIFTGLSVPRLEAAASQMVPVSVVAGQPIIREADPADRFYLVDSGTFRVTQQRDGEEVELRELEGGAVFGEIGLLRNVPRTASVTAITDGLLYSLEAEEFAELVGSGPGLRTRLLDLYRGALSH